MITNEVIIGKTFAELNFSRVLGLSTKTINDVTESITFVSSETDKSGLGYIALPYIKDGAIIEITCEAKQGTEVGSQGRIAIDFIEKVTGAKTTQYVQPDNTDEFKPWSLVAVAPRNTERVEVTFGLWTAGIGSVSIRDIRIKIHNGDPKRINDLTYKKSNKEYVLTTTGTGVFVVNGTFSMDTGSLTVDSPNKILVLTYTTPFTHTKRPNCIASVHAGTPNYEVRLWNIYTNKVEFAIFDRAGTQIDPALIPSNFYITAHIVGFDLL